MDHTMGATLAMNRSCQGNGKAKETPSGRDSRLFGAVCDMLPGRIEGFPSDP